MLLHVNIFTDEDILASPKKVTLSDALIAKIHGAVEKLKKDKDSDTYSIYKLAILFERLRQSKEPIPGKELMVEGCHLSNLICKLRQLASSNGFALKKSQKGYLLTPLPRSS
jgi:hypothetical protein